MITRKECLNRVKEYEVTNEDDRLAIEVLQKIFESERRPKVTDMTHFTGLELLRFVRRLKRILKDIGVES